MNPLQEHLRNVTRREMLGWGGYGLRNSGAGVFAGRGESAATASANDRGLPGLPHFAPRAKRVIMLLQSEALAHVDLFDYKPLLAERRGEQIPESVASRAKTFHDDRQRGQTVFGVDLTGSNSRGESGERVSDYLPHTAAVADQLCFVKR